MRYWRRTALLLALLLLLPAAARAQQDAAPDTAWLEAGSNPSPALRLALYDLGTVKVPKVVVKKYRSVIGKLNMKCQMDDSGISMLAQSSVAWLQSHTGKEDLTTLQFLKQLRNSVDDPLAPSPDCGEQSLSIVMGMGGSDLSSSQMQTLRQMVSQLQAMGGGG